MTQSLGDQALKQIHQYAKFIAGFTATEKSQVTLMNRIQAYCYDNQNLLKSFSKMIMLLYQRALGVVGGGRERRSVRTDPVQHAFLT